MENNVALHKPDVIVAVNDEGLGISHVINADLKLNVPILRAYGTPATGIDFKATQGVTPGVVCVVGHVAWSGETLAKTMGLVSTVYGTTRVFGAVLIASNSAIERLQSQGPFAYHQAIEATKIDLGFDPATGFSIQQDSYIIGTGEDALPVTREGLRLARSRMATDYRASIEFWE
jgi:hypothetical protein